MYIYDTDYYTDGAYGRFSFFVIAKNRKAAEEIIKRRCLGERLNEIAAPQKYSKENIKYRFTWPSIYYKNGQFLECLHGLIFLSALCGKNLQEKLMDHGIIHELTHKMLFGLNEIEEENLIKGIQAFESDLKKNYGFLND